MKGAHESVSSYAEEYIDRKATLKEDETIPDPSDTIPCECHQISPGIPAKLYAGFLPCNHGLRWADGDKKATAREVYEDNPGFSVKALAQLCGITENPSIFDLASHLLYALKGALSDAIF